MAEVTRQDFADMCNIEMNSLRKYISRGKIIVHGEDGKLIDTTNPINKHFKENRKAKASEKKTLQELIASIPPNPNKGRKVVLEGDEEDLGEPEPLTEQAIAILSMPRAGGRSGRVSGDENDTQRWIKLKLKGDALYSEAHAERERLLLQKAHGNLLPIDMVHDIHKRYATNFLTHFDNGVQNMATKFGQIMGADQAMIVRFAEECRHEMERCLGDAGMAAGEDIDRLIDMYSENKGRGVKKI